MSQPPHDLDATECAFLSIAKPHQTQKRRVHETYASAAIACSQANLLINEGRLEPAEEILADAMIQFPKSVALLLAQARLLQRRSSWLALAACYARIIAVDEAIVGPAGWRDYIRALKNADCLEEARAKVLIALKRFKHDRQLWHEAAEVAASQERWKDAASCWQKVFELHGVFRLPKAQLFRERTLALSNLGEFDEARRLLKYGLLLHPRNGSLRNHWIALKVAATRENRTAFRSDRSGGHDHLTIRQLCESIWSAERSLDLLDWKVNGVYLWPLMRMRLYYSLAQQVGLYDAPHPTVESRSITSERDPHTVRALKRCLWPHSLLHNLYADGASQDLAILMATKAVNGSEPYTDALRKELSGRTLLLDRTNKQHGGVFDGSLDYNDLVRSFRKRYYRLSDEIVGFDDQIKCERIADHFADSLSVSVGDLPTMCGKRIASFQAMRRGFQHFWRRHPIRTLFLTNGYGELCRPALAAAHDTGASVVELQHGTITKYHLGYSWPQRDHVPYSPDELWCFGDFWHERTPLAGNVRPRTIGAPYIEKLAKAKKVTRDDNMVVFTSQGVIGRRLLEIAMATAQLRLDKKIIYRLHPNEALGDYEEQVKSLGGAPVNFSLSHRDPNIFELLARTHTQVGVFSTTLLEGMVLGTRTVLIDLPGIEYMEAVIDRGDAILVRDQTELAERLDNAPLAKDSAYYYASPAQQLVMA